MRFAHGTSESQIEMYHSDYGSKPKAIEKAGKTLAPVQHVCHVFEDCNARCMHSNCHSVPSFGRDFTTVLHVLRNENIFMETDLRGHNSYKFNCTLLEKHTPEEIFFYIVKVLKNCNSDQFHIHVYHNNKNSFTHISDSEYIKKS